MGNNEEELSLSLSVGFQFSLVLSLPPQPKRSSLLQRFVSSPSSPVANILMRTALLREEEENGTKRRRFPYSRPFFPTYLYRKCEKTKKKEELADIKRAFSFTFGGLKQHYYT